MKRVLLIILAIGVLFSSLLGADSNRKGKGCQSTCKAYGHRYHMLDLNDEQKQDMHDIRLKYKKQIIPMQSDLKLARLDLKEAFSEKDADKKVKNAAEKVADL